MALVAVFGARPAAAPFAYVTDSRGSGQSVSVIDTASNTVVAIVPVAANAAGVAANGKHVYVAHILSPRNCLGDRIDTAANKVVATVKVGSMPEGVGVTPDGTRGYVSNAKLQHCLDDRHGRQQGSGHDPRGEFPQGASRYPGWDTRLCG
jgi:YVTN family beta-propeller protein